MANAAAKKSAAQNEKTLQILKQGMIASNLLSIIVRFFRSRGIFSLPFGFVYVLLVTSYIAEVVIFRFLVNSATPTRNANGNVMRTPSVDLANPGFVYEWTFDMLYITWACQVGSALFGEYVWWLYTTIPGYILYKVGPMAYRFLIPGGGSVPEEDDRVPEPTSKRQKKLKARQERGDPRVNSVQVKR